MGSPVRVDIGDDIQRRGGGRWELVQCAPPHRWVLVEGNPPGAK